jgi:hypothetical protein
VELVDDVDGAVCLPPPRTEDDPDDAKGQDSISLRVHRFEFQWDIFLHLSISILSLLPFTFSRSWRLSTALPVLVWTFYNGEFGLQI